MIKWASLYTCGWQTKQSPWGSSTAFNSADHEMLLQTKKIYMTVQRRAENFNVAPLKMVQHTLQHILAGSDSNIYAKAQHCWFCSYADGLLSFDRFLKCCIQCFPPSVCGTGWCRTCGFLCYEIQTTCAHMSPCTMHKVVYIPPCPGISKAGAKPCASASLIRCQIPKINKILHS